MEWIKNFFDKVNYSHWWNKKLFDKKIDVLSEIFKVINERAYNTSLAFRSTFWTIIWWTIAFLWLISKTEVTNDIKFYLVLFIISWIIWLIFSYLIDFFVLTKTSKHINKQQRLFINYRAKVKSFSFWKEDSQKINSTKFHLPSNHIIVKIIYFTSFTLLFTSLFFLVLALVKIGLNYDTLI